MGNWAADKLWPQGGAIIDADCSMYLTKMVTNLRKEGKKYYTGTDKDILKCVNYQQSPNSKLNEYRFGKQVAEIITEDKSWVTTISWSLSGQKLAFATHSSQVYVVDCICLERGEGVQRTLSPTLVLKESLPLCCLIFSTDSMLLASGFDGTLISFEISARSTHNDRGSEEKDSRKKNVMPLKYCASSKNPPIGQGNISCLQKHSSRYTNAGKGSSSFISASGSHGYFSLIRL